MTRAHRAVLWLVALAAFFVNPFFACVAEDHFEYGASEMRGAVEGTWDLTLSYADGQQQVVTIAVVQGTSASGSHAAADRGRGLVRVAAACGTRTLVASVGACESSTEMPLAVSFVSGEESLRTAAMSGNLAVHSLLFDQGELSLRIGTAQIDGTLSRAGAASGLVVAASDGNRGGTATLVRTTP